MYIYILVHVLPHPFQTFPYITCVHLYYLPHAYMHQYIYTMHHIYGRPVKHWWLAIVSCLCCDAYYPGWGPHTAEGYYVHERRRPSTYTYIVWVRRRMLWTTNVVLFKRLREVMSFSHSIFVSMVAHPTYHTYIPCTYTHLLPKENSSTDFRPYHYIHTSTT